MNDISALTSRQPTKGEQRRGERVKTRERREEREERERQRC
jgi:hypothetical protein